MAKMRIIFLSVFLCLWGIGKSDIVRLRTGVLVHKETVAAVVEYIDLVKGAYATGFDASPMLERFFRWGSREPVTFSVDEQSHIDAILRKLHTSVIPLTQMGDPELLEEFRETAKALIEFREEQGKWFIVNPLAPVERHVQPGYDRGDDSWVS
jgi:hypothetical protein